MDASNPAAADSELPQDSRDSSPVTGEDRRLGDSSHNGLSSAFTVVHGHRVGVGGSAVEEENQAQDLLVGHESPSKLMGQTANDALPGYHDATTEDEGVGGMDFNWPSQSWGFNRLPMAAQRAPAPSEDGMFGDKGSSNDSTRVEGNAASPPRSLPDMDDLDNDGLTDPPIYSEPIMHDDYGNRSTRESAPPPQFSGMVTDDDNDPPVMELQADPANNDELTFSQVAR